MSTFEQIITNTGILTFARGLQPFLSYFLIISISKFLGVEGFGNYSTIFSFHAVFQIFSSFGLKTLLTRETAQEKKLGVKYLLHGIAISIPFSFLSMIVMCLLVFYMGYSQELLIASLLVSVSLIATSLIDCYEGTLTGYQDIKIIGYLWTIENIIRVAVSILFLYMGFGLFSIVIVFTALKFSTVLFYSLYMRKYVKGHLPQLDFKFLLMLYRAARPFAIIMVFVTLYWKIDIIMLSKMRGIEEVGFYSAAYRFVWLFIVLISSFVTSVFPVISEYFKLNTRSFEMTCKKSIQYMLIIGLPICLLIYFWSERLILAIYGIEYEKSITVLKLLILTVIPYGISEIFAHALIASKNQKIDLVINGLAVIINFILNFLFIPKWGYLGATIATTVSMHMYLFMQIPFILKRILRFNPSRLLLFSLKIVVCLAAIYSVVDYMYSIHLWIGTMLSMLIYLGLIILLKVISDEDKMLAFGLIKSKFR
jgi:O-antigen/teichoic acid export membrane protein